MRSVNSRFGSLCVLDGRSGVFALAAFSAGLVSTLPALVVPANAQESASAPVPAAGPEVRIIQPQYADQLKGQVQILVGVRANGFAPKTIELIVDGKLATEGALKLESLPSANFAWDTRKFTDGPHKLSVVVTDAGGFRGTQEVPVYINNARQKDLAPPALKWLNVKSGDNWRGIVNVQLKVVDDFGVKWLFLLLNPASEPLRKPARFSWFLNRPPYTFQIDSRKFQDGQYVLRALAYDVLENEGAAPALTIGISNNSINPTWISPDSAVASALTPPKVTGSKPQTAPSDRVGTAPSPGGATDSKTPEAVTPETTTPKNTGQVAPSTQITPASANTKPVVSSRAVSSPRNTETTVAAALHNGSIADGQHVAKAPDTLPGFNVPRLQPRANGRTGTGQSTSPLQHSTRVAEAPNGNDSVEAPVMSPSLDDATESRIAPVGSSESSGRTSASSDRLAAVDASRRTALTGAPAVGYVDGGPRDGSVASPQSNGAGGTSRHDGSGKISLPASTEGRMAAIERNTSARSSTPSLSAESGTGVDSRISEARPGRVAAAPSNSGRVVAPMAPSRLPHIGGATAPNLSNNLGNAAMAQGSVAAPPSSPLFPSPNLGAPRDTRPASPLIAALPPLAPAARAAKAAITVMPLATAIPAAHIVKQTQSLASVARGYKLPVQLLAAANHLPVGASLKVGQKVLLPQPLQVSYLGQPVTGDVASMMMGETGVTPFRFLFEKQGGKLQWDSKNQRVTARNATHQVTLSIGSRTAAVNNKAVMMDLAAFLVSGRTMVPLRFFEKALQARVEWEPTTGRLFVAMAS